MIFLTLLMLLLTLCEVTPIRVNITEPTQTKTKRGLIEQTHVYGETTAFKPINIYADNVGAASQPGIGGYYTPKYQNTNLKQVFDAEPKVTAQQVLYEYQQTPHNSVSNVHVNQQFQTQQHSADVRPEATQQVAYTNYPNANQAVPQSQTQQQSQHTNQFQASAETVATPVHHSSYVQHVPYVPHQLQTQVNPYLLGKYIYVNGKYVYYPQPVPNPYYQSHLQQQQIQQQQHLQQQLHQQPQHHPQQLPQKQYIATPKHPQQRLMPPSVAAPMSYQYNQQINKPVQPKEKPVEEIEEPTKADLEEDEEDEEVEEKGEVQNETEENDDEDDRSNYRNGDEEEDDDKFGRYTFDEDEEEEEKPRYRQSAEEDEEEDDSNRESSSYRRNKRKPIKPTNKYTNTNYRVKEGYKTKTRYSNSKVKPNKKSKTVTTGTKPTKEYKAYTFTKTNNGKPKIEMIEGKYSQNVPVAVQKVYREKWFITRNKDQ